MSYVVTVKQDLVVLQNNLSYYTMDYLVRPGFGPFKTIKKKPLMLKLKDFSVCNFKDRYIFASGGVSIF